MKFDGGGELIRRKHCLIRHLSFSVKLFTSTAPTRSSLQPLSLQNTTPMPVFHLQSVPVPSPLAKSTVDRIKVKSTVISRQGSTTLMHISQVYGGHCRPLNSEKRAVPVISFPTQSGFTCCPVLSLSALCCRILLHFRLARLSKKLWQYWMLVGLRVVINRGVD